MTEFTHLSKAPITEAIIQYGVVPREGLTLDELAKLADSVLKKFKGDLRVVHPLFDMDGELLLDVATGEAIPTIHHKAQVGLKLESSVDHKAVLLTLHGVSFHKLKPYTSWTEVFGEASQLWSHYRSATQPISIRRLGTRFINRLQLPVPARLSEYLSGPPLVSDEFLVAGYLRRLNLRHQRTNLRVNMVEAVEMPSADVAGDVVVILDNDVYTIKSTVPTDDGAVNELFEQMHQLKNELFWNSLTPQVLESYK